MSLSSLLGVYISQDLKIYPPDFGRINVKFLLVIWVTVRVTKPVSVTVKVTWRQKDE